MSGFELHYINGGTDIDLLQSYVADFTLERELEKLLDKLTIKVSRRVDNAAGFTAFDPNIEILLKFNGTGIFRGRVKTADKKEFYTVEVYSSDEILARTMAHKIYTNTTPEAIFTDLMQTYTDLTPVVAYSGTTIDRLVADDYINSIVTGLQQALGWSIYTDSSKNIYFQPRGNVTNSVVINRQASGSNAIFGQWKKDHNEMCNDIRVTGDNVNYNTTQTFTGDGLTTTFILNEQPIHIKISFNTNNEQSIGSYNVNAETKTIIFNAPPSSGTTITIDYTYAYPILVERTDAISIGKYGTFIKSLFLKWLKSRADVTTYCNNYLTTYSNPLLSNDLVMSAAYITSFTPGDQVQIIDDLEGYNANYVINKIKLQYTTGTVQLNIGSYIPIFVNVQGSLQDRIKELEKNISKSSIQLYDFETETLAPSETLNQSSAQYLNFKTIIQPKCDYGRGTSYDARIELCQS